MTMVKQLGGLALGLGITLSLACAESPVTLADEGVVSFAKGGNGRGGGPPATVTLRDAQPDGIYSDNGSTYVHGSERVEVAITATDFHFKPSTHKNGTRRVWLSLGAGPDPDPFGGARELGYGSDFRIHGGLLGIACEQTALTHGRLAWIGQQGQGPWHELSFGVPGNGGDLLTISRADNGDDTSTWTVTSQGPGEFYIDNVWQGTFDVPFQFTVVGEGTCP